MLRQRFDAFISFQHSSITNYRMIWFNIFYSTQWENLEKPESTLSWNQKCFSLNFKKYSNVLKIGKLVLSVTSLNDSLNFYLHHNKIFYLGVTFPKKWSFKMFHTQHKDVRVSIKHTMMKCLMILIDNKWRKREKKKCNWTWLTINYSINKLARSCA